MPAFLAQDTRQRFQPWLMAIIGMLVVMVTNGLTKTGITAFDTAILAEFGWTRGQFKFRDFLTLLVVGVSAPFVGYLIDKFAIRVLMTAGLVLFTGLYLSYGHISSLTELYLVHIGFGMVLVLAGVNAAVILASHWFVVRRGTAVGLVVMGSSLGGMVIPPLIVWLLKHMAWREAFALLAVVPAVAALMVYGVVDTPLKKGLRPHGEGVGDGVHRAGGRNDLTLAQTLRTRSFWALGVVAMTSFYALLSVSSHLFLHMRDMGYDPAQSSAALATLFIPGLVSKFLFGYLADHFPVRKVLFCNLAIMLTGLMCLASFQRALLWPGIAIVGVGWGGIYILGALQGVNCFGLTHSGKILGCLSCMDTIAGGIGIWVTGLLFDYYGTYQFAFSGICVLIAVALACSLLIRNETRPIDPLNGIRPAPSQPGLQDGF